MISHLLGTVGPVFLIVLVGFVSVRRGLFDAPAIDALMRYSIRFAIPCLLFRAVSRIDLGAAYDARTMVSFYVPALLCFALSGLLARRVFARRPGEAVAVGFAGLFSNLVLLGIPVVERTLGQAALPTAFAIVSLHAPFCYALGIVSMELLRADGRTLAGTARVVTRTLFGNALMIGIGLGFAVNLSGLVVPTPVGAALDMVAASALPVALVGLGGTLVRYALSERIGETVTVVGISLLLHPALAFGLAAWLDVEAADRSALVLMASMAPGANAYLFAAMYARAEGTAAASVLLGTVCAPFTVTLWSYALGGV